MAIEVVLPRLNSYALVTFDPDKVSKQEITEKVEDFGYDVE